MSGVKKGTMPVVIRGVHYPSASHAANKLGVTPQAIYNALNRGAIDRVGLGPRNGAMVGNWDTRTARPVTIGGRTFKSMRELDKFLGRSPGYTRVTLKHRRWELLVFRYWKIVSKQEQAKAEAERIAQENEEESNND